MLTDDALRLLLSHQQAVLGLLDGATALLAGEPAAIRHDLAEARWRIGRAMRAYQLFKHVEVFDPLIARGDAEQRRTALAMKAACLRAGDAYWTFAQRWLGEDLVLSWAAYRAAARDMADKIRAHIAQERAGIGRLLVDVNDMRRVPVRPETARVLA